MTQNTRATQLESLQLKNKEPEVNIQREVRKWSKDARKTENEKTGYESISADHAGTALISFRCVKAKKKNKIRIHPISGHSP
jgi:hypothetical protein